jgi:hypothetical protein
MYQQLWGYKVEDKLYLGVGEQKRLNTTALGQQIQIPQQFIEKISDSRRKILLFL